MVAQFMEIYYARNFINIAIKSILININDVFMSTIAKKLHFAKKNIITSIYTITSFISI